MLLLLNVCIHYRKEEENYDPFPSRGSTSLSTITGRSRYEEQDSFPPSSEAAGVVEAVAAWGQLS